MKKNNYHKCNTFSPLKREEKKNIWIEKVAWFEVQDARNVVEMNQKYARHSMRLRCLFRFMVIDDQTTI